MGIKNNTTKLQEILNKVNALPEASEGVELPELTNEGTASDMLADKQLIDSEGNVVTGTIPTNTSSNLTASGATITVPAGYYAAQTSKSVATATQATPSVSVDNNGLITASATQTAGYVSAGTKSATKQLTVQGAKTVTPSTSSQTAVAAGTYTTGAITVAAMPTATRAETTISVTADDTNDKLTITASNNQSTGYVTGSNKTASKTITLTASGSTVTASDGTNKVSKSVATATQATPSVSINSSGLITASATQSAGYVTAGTKSGTKQLTTQAAKTITPSTISQTAVASSVYTTGAITVAAIPSDYVKPSGELAITANGTHDVKSYASVNVNVAAAAEDLDTELDAQETKLNELLTILDTKAIGSNDSCTLASVNYEGNTDTMQIKYTALVNGELTIKEISNPTFPLTDIVKNTMLYIRYDGAWLGCYESWNDLTGDLNELINYIDYDNSVSRIVILVKGDGSFKFTEEL